MPPAVAPAIRFRFYARPVEPRPSKRGHAQARETDAPPGPVTSGHALYIRPDQETGTPLGPPWDSGMILYSAGADGEVCLATRFGGISSRTQRKVPYHCNMMAAQRSVCAR